MLRIREFEERVKRTFVEHPGVIRGHTHLADGAEASIVGSIATLGAERPVLRDLPLPRLPARARDRPEGDDGRDLRPQGRPLQGHRRLDAPRPTSRTASSARRGSSPPGSRTRPARRGRRRSASRARSSCASSATAPPSRARSRESLNIASLWKLPIVFVMENNGYNVHTRTEQEDANRANGEDLSVKAKAFSMPGVTIDGRDPIAVLRDGRRGGRARPRGRRADARRVADVPALGPRQHHRPARRAAALPRARGDREVRRARGVRGRPEGRPGAGLPRPARRRRHAHGRGGRRRSRPPSATRCRPRSTFGLESPFPDVESALEYIYA